MRIIQVATVVVLSLSLMACENMSKQDIGVITGGLVGGVLGNQVGGGTGRLIATVGGAALGAYLGSQIGASMDKTDRLAMNRALEKTPTKHKASWTNPDSGVQYTVEPTRTYQQVNNGVKQPCRTFTTTAIIDGKAEKVEGKACRQDNGTWHLM